MVAKSYQTLEILCEPFKENNKMYVNVKYKNSPKRVRWYTPEEYLKMYPEEKKNFSENLSYDLKSALGFSEGFITVFSGNTYGNLEYFKRSIARYHNIFGWYVVSTDPLPCDLPVDVIPHRLDWSDVSINETLLPEARLTEVVNKLRYPPSKSIYVGTIGERLDLKLKVQERREIQGYYGLSLMHILRDSDDNEYVWNTTAKALDQGATYLLRATIKDHREYQNRKQTILTRCTVTSALGQL